MMCHSCRHRRSPDDIAKRGYKLLITDVVILGITAIPFGMTMLTGIMMPGHAWKWAAASVEAIG
jgi:hypothetical protein